VELVREPEVELGPLAMGLTMGQWLCVPMILGGALLIWSSRREPLGRSQSDPDRATEPEDEESRPEPALSDLSDE
jgi:phosphatidylglycerol:prolipoprotein diacylglycerol transferase